MPTTEINLVDSVLEHWPERIRPCIRGNVLYWQGDPVESERFAEQIGADAYASDAAEGVRKIKALIAH